LLHSNVISTSYSVPPHHLQITVKGRVKVGLVGADEVGMSFSLQASRAR